MMPFSNDESVFVHSWNWRYAKDGCVVAVEVPVPQDIC